MSPAFILYIYRNDTCVLLCVHTYPYICISGWIYTQGPASAPQTCILIYTMCCHICLFIHFLFILFSLRITLECNASLCLEQDFIIYINPQYLGRREKVRQNSVALRNTCQQLLSYWVFHQQQQITPGKYRYIHLFIIFQLHLCLCYWHNVLHPFVVLVVVEN